MSPLINMNRTGSNIFSYYGDASPTIAPVWVPFVDSAAVQFHQNLSQYINPKLALRYLELGLFPCYGSPAMEALSYSDRWRIWKLLAPISNLTWYCSWGFFVITIITILQHIVIHAGKDMHYETINFFTKHLNLHSENQKWTKTWYYVFGPVLSRQSTKKTHHKHPRLFRVQSFKTERLF